MATFFFSNSRPQTTKLATLFFNILFLFLLSLFLKAYLCPSNSNHLLDQHCNGPSTTIFNHARILQYIKIDACTDLHKRSNYSSKCLYVKSHLHCNSRGYINYLQIFYCNLGQFPILGYALLVLWFVVLFYLLGDTASGYFCPSLKGLSEILRLAPTITGAILLSLGNGAPDFFASIVSFTRSSNGAVGLNSILGGALFVSSTVLGTISILVSPKQITVDKVSFIRDVGFLLFSLFILLVIIYIGKINLWGSICYLSIYFLYVYAVSVPHFIYKTEKKENEIAMSSVELEMAESGIPILGNVDDEKEKPKIAENVDVAEDKTENPESSDNDSLNCNYLGKFLKVLELPLCLPRRLTIPIVSEEKWSKPFAVISVTLAPVMLAAICNTQWENVGTNSNLVTYLSAAIVGFVLGYMASVTTKSSSPPSECLFPWLAGGFVMSVIWTYLIAKELVSLLYSLGNIIGVNPSILGLTILAWGNSLGDLISNGAMALKGGKDGVQIAISGCYAGPMFNTLMGLGLPLVLLAWSEYPHSYVIPKDPSLYETLLFLMVGLIWALVILPKKNMRLDKPLGAGLLIIYLCFLFIRIAMAIGVLKL